MKQKLLKTVLIGGMDAVVTTQKPKAFGGVKSAWTLILFLALLAGCTRRDNYYNPGQPVSNFSQVNYYPVQPVSMNNNYYSTGQTVSQNNNYYLEPFVSTVTGVLVVKTVDPTDSCNKCLINIYVLDTAPITVSNVNVLNGCTDIAVNNITMFQLAGCEALDLSPYIGRRVRLTGKFFFGCAPYHYTKLLMDVCKVEVLAPYQPTCCVRQNWVRQCPHRRQ